MDRATLRSGARTHGRRSILAERSAQFNASAPHCRGGMVAMMKRFGSLSKPSQRRVSVTSLRRPPGEIAEKISTALRQFGSTASHMIAMPSRTMRASSTQGER